MPFGLLQHPSCGLDTTPVLDARRIATCIRSMCTCRNPAAPYATPTPPPHTHTHTHQPPTPAILVRRSDCHRASHGYTAPTGYLGSRSGGSAGKSREVEAEAQRGAENCGRKAAGGQQERGTKLRVVAP